MLETHYFVRCGVALLASIGPAINQVCTQLVRRHGAARVVHSHEEDARFLARPRPRRLGRGRDIEPTELDSSLRNDPRTRPHDCGGAQRPSEMRRQPVDEPVAVLELDLRVVEGEPGQRAVRRDPDQQRASIRVQERSDGLDDGILDRRIAGPSSTYSCL